MNILQNKECYILGYKESLNRATGVSHVVECLLSKCETWSSSPITDKKEEKALTNIKNVEIVSYQINKNGNQ
jgi:hypothetical protein